MILVLGQERPRWLQDDEVVLCDDELDAIRRAESSVIRAIVAPRAADAIRAGALRDLLGVYGQGREDAIALRDLVALRRRLEQRDVPVVRCAPVERIADLYWYGHHWGYPLRVRQRRVNDWPTVAELRDEADVRAFTCGGLTPRLEVVPSLVVEPELDGRRVAVSRRDGGECPVAAGAVAEAALSCVAPSGRGAWRVELVSAGADWLVDSVSADTQAQVDLGVPR